MTGWRARIAGYRSADPQVVDVLLTLVVIGGLELECWLGNEVTSTHRVVTAIACIPFAAPIAIRHRAPRPALLSSVLIGAVQGMLYGELLTSLTGVVVPVLVLAYSVGVEVEFRAGIVTVLIAVAALTCAAFLPGAADESIAWANVIPAVGSSALIVLPAWFVGRLVRERNRRAGAFGRLEATFADELHRREVAAIEAERARIGRELQDIVAHSVTMMVVQAGGARVLMHGQPDRARAAILTVERTGREVLVDLRRMLGILRNDGSAPTLTARPGLARVESLIDKSRRSGLECEIRSVGSTINLTPGTDLLAYRIIEAVLSAATERAVHRALVTIRFEPSELGIEVHGDRSVPGLRQNLQDMAHRIALYDGGLEIDDTHGSGFTVFARLPLNAMMSA